jgi:cytoskeletal protein CcmA (bactofilin family)
MSIWKDNTASLRTPTPVTPTPVPGAKEPARAEASPKAEIAYAPVAPTPRADAGMARKESLIAADITIEGKIEGGGSVRIAGKFHGDVNVQGDLAIETGAKLTGSVRADKVTIAGELEGNVEQASRVELQQSAVLTGDVKAGALTVAAGARMRGQVEFGWDDGRGSKPGKLGLHSAESGIG